MQYEEQIFQIQFKMKLTMRLCEPVKNLLFPDDRSYSQATYLAMPVPQGERLCARFRDATAGMK
ncbi:hypothetical protein A6A26_01780 [Pantoea sp. OXWO6B1]|nr:hypothetical protein A6A26_01780 [Pantoea sp. OXWO6B1]